MAFPCTSPRRLGPSLVARTRWEWPGMSWWLFASSQVERVYCDSSEVGAHLMGWVGTQPRAACATDLPKITWLSARRSSGFIPPEGPVSPRLCCQRCWNICASHGLARLCLCNYCCCSSPLGACQAPNAACHVSSASQAGKDSLHGSGFPGLQDGSCGAPVLSSPSVLGGSCWS